MKNDSQLFNCAREKLRNYDYSPQTQKSYTDWIYRFLFFYNNYAPECFGEQEIVEFITFLEKDRNLATSTKNQALTAIHFFYREVLKIPYANSKFNYSNIGHQEPTVLTHEEIRKILSRLRGEKWVMTSLLYGCGLTLTECLQMRVRNINFNLQKIVVNDRTGKNLRETLLPQSLFRPLKRQIEKVRILYEENNAYQNFEGALLPGSTKNKELKTSKEFNWQFLFPSKTPRLHKKSGKVLQFPLSESYLQKAIKEVLYYCGIDKAACCHSFRHSFATHLLEFGYDIHLIQELLGHKNLQSTMVYKNLAKPNKEKVISPLDRLLNLERKE